jgi:hypothetical protein
MAEVASFYAFGTSFLGGLTVAAADVNGDGHPDLIVGAASGGSGDVKVIDGTKLGQVGADMVIADSALLYHFPAFDNYTGGLRVASGDVDGDGKADVVVAAITGVSHVKVFSGADLSPLASFMLTRNDTWGAGLSLAVGDRDNDGKDEVYVAYNSGVDTDIHIYDGVGGAELGQLTPFVGFKGAVSMSVLDSNNDGKCELAVTSASGIRSHLKVIDQLMTDLASFYVQGLGSNGIRVSSN